MLHQTNLELDAAKQALETLEQEKSELSNTLDLTVVQNKNDESRYDAERRLLHDQHTQRLAEILQKEKGCEIQGDFNELAVQLESMFADWSEDKSALTTLINEKDDMQSEIDSLGYKLQILIQEKDALSKTVASGETGKLQKRLQEVSEERSEIRNDFCIKFENLSSEISLLKSKLAQYEPEEKEEMKQDQ